MRRRLAVLLLIPMILCLSIGSAADTPPRIEPTLEAVATVATEPTEETIAPTTEPTIPETTAPPETEPPVTEPIETESIETESIETEPPVKEPELASIGRFKLTAYCSCRKCCGKYADNRPVDENGETIVYGSIGVRLKAGVSIAVDPRVIPYGTDVVINGHTYIAQDTGGSIVGNRIDVYFDDHQEAWNFGTQYAEVFVYV